jgi:hypothetical protein
MSSSNTKTYSVEIAVSVDASDQEEAWLKVNDLAQQMTPRAKTLGCTIGEVSEPYCIDELREVELGTGYQAEPQ